MSKLHKKLCCLLLLIASTSGMIHGATAATTSQSTAMSPDGTTARKMRVARPSDDLSALLRFYREGLGLELLYEFRGHEGFDGIILGKRAFPYHFEFTHHRGHKVGRAPTQDHLITLYYPDKNDWMKAVDRLRELGFQPVTSYNPYWDIRGKTFEDPDGYRIVLEHDDWTR